MDRDETEAVRGGHLHRCLDIVDHHKGRPIGAESTKARSPSRMPVLMYATWRVPR